MRKHPLISFFVLAYALTWWIYPLLKLSPLLGLPGLFGPALAAMIMAASQASRTGTRGHKRSLTDYDPWAVTAGPLEFVKIMSGRLQSGRGTRLRHLG